MKFLAGAVLLTLSIPALAQQQSTPPPTQPADTWRMPHERGFWGHAGVSFGNSKLDVPEGAFSCLGLSKLNQVFGKIDAENGSF